MTGEPTSMPPDPDSEGCLCVVASYSDLAAAVDSVTMEVADRFMMSPVLGDFIELRFTDIGPRPEDANEPGPAAAVILADELTHPTSGVGRNYFALVIADPSAALAEQLLDRCAEVPAVSGLPIRFRGIASVDDRQPESRPGGQAAEIVVSPTAAWSHDALVAELRHYGEELLRYFAPGHQPAAQPEYGPAGRPSPATS